MIVTRFAQVSAWLCFIAILFVTVSPIGLRPHDVMTVGFDRAFSFAVMSALFVIAFPRHWVIVAILMIAVAGVFELSQELSPSRHAKWNDAVVKAAGAVIGTMIGWAANRIRLRFDR